METLALIACFKDPVNLIYFILNNFLRAFLNLDDIK